MNFRHPLFAFMQVFFVLAIFGFFSPRKTNFYYCSGNTIIPPRIKRFPAAGHLCYRSGAFMLPRPVKDLAKATIRKSICDLEKSIRLYSLKRFNIL